MQKGAIVLTRIHLVGKHLRYIRSTSSTDMLPLSPTDLEA